MRGGSIPDGTVTFLFTDIEGSTALWESHPEAMRVSLAIHDALMRSHIEACGGYVFKTIGDAFCAAFSTARSAIEATLLCQRAISAESWPNETRIKVRMAVHTGSVECREMDYFGPPVNRVARLLSVAHGGQCVVSQTTFDLVRDFPPNGVTFADLGSHQLKDLARREQVYQLIHEALVRDFPALRSLSNTPNNLPQQLSSFIGREREIDDVERLLATHRLVTLTGAGGTGKTRLALQVAANVLDRFPDGGWFVELAPVSDAALLIQTVADAVGAHEQVGKPMIDALVLSLKSKRLLLIIDNSEHLLDASARLVDTLLRQCPGVVVMVTSRSPLGITGEFGYRLQSLSLPDPTKRQTATSLSHFEAVRLFIERAVQAQPTFSVTNDNAPALASLCCRVDGIPLAIELAAARVRSLSIEEINQRLDQRFRLLTGGSRTALPRQQTLRSLIDWSYDLLNEQERLVFRRLSVFAGGWTVESATAVCASEEIEDWEVLDLITSLCDKSLAVTEQSHGTTRFRYLESIRQYAHDRLVESGEYDAERGRHLGYFSELAEHARPFLRGADQKTWLDRLEVEHDNCRVALDWSVDHAITRDGLKLAAALWRFWLLRGHVSEGRRRLDRAIALDDNSDLELRARALNGAGNLAEIQQDYTVSKAFHNEGLAISRARGDRFATATALNNLGNSIAMEGDFPSAVIVWEEALVLWRALETEGNLDDKRGLAATIDNLGINAEQNGEWELAKEYYDECLRLRRAAGNHSGVAFGLMNLGVLSHRQSHFEEARKLFSEGLRIFQELGDPLGLATCFEWMAWPRDPATTVQLIAAAQRIRDDHDFPRPPTESSIVESALSQASAAFEHPDDFDSFWGVGKGLSTDEAIALALAD